MINISIIGLGSMGQNHLRVISELKNTRINFLYDKNIKKVKHTDLDKYGYNKNKIKKQNFKKLNAEHKL